MQLILCFTGLILAVLGVVHSLPGNYKRGLQGGIYNITNPNDPEVLFLKEVMISYIRFNPQIKDCTILNFQISSWNIREQVVAGILYYFDWILEEVLLCPQEPYRPRTLYYRCEAKAASVSWLKEMIFKPTPICVPLEEPQGKGMILPPTGQEGGYDS